MTMLGMQQLEVARTIKLSLKEVEFDRETNSSSLQELEIEKTIELIEGLVTEINIREKENRFTMHSELDKKYKYDIDQEE